jgi:hypothetical protein
VRLFIALLLAVAGPAVAAQPASLVATPDTLYWDETAAFETPFVIRNAGPDSLRLDSLTIGSCGENCFPAYSLLLLHQGAAYFAYVYGPGITDWGGFPPDILLAPADSAELFIQDIDGCPVCEGGQLDPDTFAPVLFWAGGAPEPLERTLAYRYPVANEPAAARRSFGLTLGGPNPFRGETALLLRMAAPGEAEVTLFDGLGRRVRTLAEGALGARTYRLAIRAEGLTPGLYFASAVIRTWSTTTTLTRRLVLLR